MSELAANEVLRTNTINPTLDDNVLTELWESLAAKLNACSDGPTLSPLLWKKRFTDWRNSTKSKYRNLKNALNKTGGGVNASAKMNSYELRALDLWGKVTVDGSVDVLVTGGLPAGNYHCYHLVVQ